MSRTISILTQDGPMPVAFAEAATPRGGVVVIQEAFGLTSHVESVVDRLCADGWTAVAPALYHRSGNATFDYSDLEPALEEMWKLSPEQFRSDVDAAFAHLEVEGFDASRTALVGFCMGGAIAMDQAARRALGACVTWYGGGVVQGRFGLPPLTELAPLLCTPWLGLYGRRDHSIEPEQVDALEDALVLASVPHQLIRYDAGHGFNCDDRPDHYDRDAAHDAWSRMLDWLRVHVAEAA